MFPVIQQAAFVDRINFGKFLNRRKLLGKGVEVGTDRGDMALKILDTWHGEQLTCVDPWVAGYDDGDPVSCRGKNRREHDYGDAQAIASRFQSRCRLWRMYSNEAMTKFIREELDFVYIDGNHQEAYFRDDLYGWFGKVKPGGIIAGHDIVCPGEDPQQNWGRILQPVLFQFCQEMSIPTIYLVVETQCLPWSFYVEVPQR